MNPIFVKNDQNFVIAYINGVAITDVVGINVVPYAGFGVFFGTEHPGNLALPVQLKDTHNAAEIEAAIKTISIVGECNEKALCIRSTNKVLVNSMTHWIRGWESKTNWKKSDGKPVENKELLTTT